MVGERTVANLDSLNDNPGSAVENAVYVSVVSELVRENWN